MSKKGQYFPLHLSFAERRHCIHFSSLAKIPCLPLAKEQYCLSYRKHNIAPFSFLGKKAVSPSPPLLKMQCAPLALFWQKGSITRSSPCGKRAVLPPVTLFHKSAVLSLPGKRAVGQLPHRDNSDCIPVSYSCNDNVGSFLLCD